MFFPLGFGIKQVQFDSVSSGLNLWLTLKSEKDMPELLRVITSQRNAIDFALKNLHNVHFARFVPTPDSKVLQVITAFDGELDAYILDFVLAIGKQFDMILEHIQGWPPKNAQVNQGAGTYSVKDHPAEFLEFIHNNNQSYKGKKDGGVELFSAYPEQTVIDIVGASAIVPKASEPVPVAVNREDVQSNILRSVARHFACHLGLEIGSLDAARTFIQELLDENNALHVSTDKTWDVEDPPEYLLNIGFTYRGLSTLGITEQDRNAFKRSFKSFINGPDRGDSPSRQGDVGDADPYFWQLGGSYPVDVMVSIYADDQNTLFELESKLLESATDHQLILVNKPWHAQAMVDPEHPKRRYVHFGYVDGVSNVRLAIQDQQPSPDELQPRANVGDFLLGKDYPNVYGGQNSLGGISSELAENATFVAFRIMEQDVDSFEQLLKDEANNHNVDPEWVAAKLMGRWRDGTPLLQSPSRPLDESEAPPRNDFDYLEIKDSTWKIDDSTGERCPIGAHIRRMNPRSSIVAGRPHSRRLIRRGMPYVEGDKRGLIGLFMCADLERQFEFILRQWAHGDRATTGIVGEHDPILNAQKALDRDADSRFSIPQPGTDSIEFHDMPRLVKTVGSCYLFMPGIAGLHYIASAESRNQKPISKHPPDSPDSFDPRRREFRADPFPVYAWFRQHYPVANLPIMESTWVFSYEDVVRVASDTKNFRKRKIDDERSNGLLTMDPPPHTSCRAQLEPLFKNALNSTKDDFNKLVISQYIQNCYKKGVTDWVSNFSKPVAQGAFFSLFGLPLDSVHGLIGQVELILRMATPAAAPETRDKIDVKLKQLGVYMYKKHLPEAKQGGLYHSIHQMNQVHDAEHNKENLIFDAATVEEMVNAVTMTLTGLLPLQWFITLAVWRLLENNGKLLTQLRENPSISDLKALNELLRYDMSPPMADRYVVKDGTKLGNLELRKDSRVTLVFASANRDETKFGADADHVNFMRPNEGPGLAFGVEPQRICLGHDMVKAVMLPVIKLLRETDPIPALAPGFTPNWGSFHEGAMFRAMTDLYICSNP